MTMTGPKYQKRTARPEEYKELTSHEFLNMKICCEKCKSMIVRRNMKKHQETRTCILKNKKIRDEGTDNNTNETNLQDEDNMTVKQGTTFTVFWRSD